MITKKKKKNQQNSTSINDFKNSINQKYEGNFLNWINGTYGRLIANIVFNSEKLNSFPLKLETR